MERPSRVGLLLGPGMGSHRRSLVQSGPSRERATAPPGAVPGPGPSHPWSHLGPSYVFPPLLLPLPLPLPLLS
jgi:hypothetical protein